MNLVDPPRVVEDALRQRCLARVDMRANTNVADLLHLGSPCFLQLHATFKGRGKVGENLNSVSLFLPGLPAECCHSVIRSGCEQVSW